ncbi:putative senescence/spartin-associated [Lupinus albus]|uniref:Putative senescence/spartin-associated n=1 Tax=Lupinus albus TaxID=3870 RepID=A0A6A4QGC2_LUPAL|nr:putative senescence/spartin-associated [Lupinus albus]
MASQNADTRISLYPQVIDSNPNPLSSSSSSSSSSQSRSSLYPSIDLNDLHHHDLFPPTDHDRHSPPSAPPSATQDILLNIPGAILNLIDQQYSVELASGNFSVIRLRQGDNAVAVYACVADEIQWPLANDMTAVKVDDSHYFFSFRVPNDSADDNDSTEFLSYGLTIASKGQENLLKELDSVLDSCCNFSVHRVSEKAKMKGEVLDDSMAKEFSAKELECSAEKKELMEGQCAAYWTTLAPNVEDYSGSAARLIANGSGKVIKGILWCGDVTMERLNWGNKVLKKRMSSGEQAQINPKTLKRIKRVKRVTKMTEKVANGVLSGVVSVSGFFTSTVVNSKAGKKFFSLLPGEVMLASLDGFSKVCDALEVTGKNVMSTSSTVTTELVNHRYGEQAAEATSEGLSAAGHAFGTAWAAVKIRKAINPKSVFKPTTLVKSGAKAAASELKAGRTK